MKTLADPVHRLVERRRAALNERSRFDWLPVDGVTGFLLPHLWFLHRARGDTTRAVRQQGRAAYLKAASRYLVFRDRLQSVVGALSGKGIPVIVLKGIALSQQLYPSPGLRHMDDIDLLLRPRDIQEGLQALLGLGWRAGQPADRGESPTERIGWSEDTGQVLEMVLFDPAGRVPLELHQHVIPYTWLRNSYAVEMEAIWNQAVPMDAEGLDSALTLSPIHTLAYQCLHLAQHGLLPLRFHLDVDLILRNAKIDRSWSWPEFVRCAERWRIRSAVYHCFRFCRWLFDSPVPAWVLKELDPGGAAKARVRSILRPEDLVADRPLRLGARYPTLVKAFLPDRMRDLFRLAMRMVSPERSWRRYRYGREATLFHHWRHAWGVFSRGS